MKNILSLACLLLVLACLCASADASPKDRKITVACSALAPDIITGSAIVTACADSTCATQTVSCPQIYCDSSAITAPSTTTESCPTQFKVTAIMYNLSYVDTDVNGNTIISSGEVGATSTLQKGSVGFANSIGYGNDTVTLTVK